VIFRYLINCYVLPAENAVVKNPIAGLKKKHFGFYTSVFWALIAGQDSLPRQKNLSNRAETRLFPKRRSTRRNRYTVTTSHMFHLGRPRFATVFATELRLFREQLQREAPGGGGGAARRISLETTLSITSHGNFHAMPPLLYSDAYEKTPSHRVGRAIIPFPKQHPKIPMSNDWRDST
jgi:hypothetical protein